MDFIFAINLQNLTAVFIHFIIAIDIPNANLNNVIDSLTAQGAIKPGNDKTSIQISGGGGKRFLAIPLKKLK